MRTYSAQIVHYRRSLPRPITTSHGRYHEREGLLLIVRDGWGQIGIGDASPLSGISIDSTRECEAALTQLNLCRFMPGIPPMQLLFDYPTSAQEYFARADEEQSASRRSEFHSSWFTASSHLVQPDSPSAFFAVGSALGELRSKHEKLALCRSLSQSEVSSRVPINGLITAPTVDDASMQARKLDASGFRAFKVKVGYDSAADDVLRIRAASESAPEALLRLDANGGWDPAWAERVLSQIPLRQIDFIEQPFPRGHWQAAYELAKKYRIRLALDEEIQTLNDAEGLIVKHACDAIVLKPMVLGHLYGCFLLARRAREAGIEVIYTSSWESDIGIAATLHLAAALGPNPPAMGLSTAGMISDGIVKTPLKIENGFLNVPEGPGLGLELAPELLAQLN